LVKESEVNACYSLSQVLSISWLYGVRGDGDLQPVSATSK